MKLCLTENLLHIQIAIKLMELQMAKIIILDKNFVLLSFWKMTQQDKWVVIKEVIGFGEQDLQKTLIFFLILIHVILILNRVFQNFLHSQILIYGLVIAQIIKVLSYIRNAKLLNNVNIPLILPFAIHNQILIMSIKKLIQFILLIKEQIVCFYILIRKLMGYSIWKYQINGFQLMLRKHVIMMFPMN